MQLVEGSQFPIAGPVLFTRQCYADSRGLLTEVYQEARVRQAGVTVDFVQDNFSSSAQGVLRGLHYQIRQPQAKLITVLRGAILDVGVDLRPGSPTFAKWFSVTLSASNGKVLYLPEGFAHGFAVVTGPADVLYKCSNYYAADDQYGIVWDDDTLAIDWQLSAPELSEKDRALPRLETLTPAQLPR